ncbi:MAG: DUF2203 family protein [Acidobacteriota bacterium]|nr:DUF2203 family protein [Acidobacteriota bacterium]
MQHKIYKLDEARSLIPWIREACEEAEKQVREVQQSESNLARAQTRIKEIIHHWAETVFKLGGLPKQPFTVDFDNGTDFYCWEFPEKDIYYRHAYHAGYAGRRRIEEDN